MTGSLNRSVQPRRSTGSHGRTDRRTNAEELNLIHLAQFRNAHARIPKSSSNRGNRMTNDRSNESEAS